MRTRSILRPITASAFLAIAGCSFYMPADMVKSQASFDLQCPDAQLEITPLSGDFGKKVANQYDCTLGVRGCGKQTTYSHVPGTNTWVANAAVSK